MKLDIASPVLDLYDNVILDVDTPANARQLLVKLLSLSLAEGNKEALDIICLGIRIKNEDEVELTDKESDLLKRCIDKNAAGYVAIIVWNLMRRF